MSNCEQKKGQSVLAIAKTFKEQGYIRSSSVLTNIIVSQNKEDSVVLELSNLKDEMNDLLNPKIERCL